MNLTNEEIRIKVAEAMGYERRPCEWQNFIEWYDPSGKYLPPIEHVKHLDRQALHVPNYPEDLNACASFEATLTDAEHLRYRVRLWNVVITEGDETTWDRQFISATARQRCIAFLKTKGIIP